MSKIPSFRAKTIRSPPKLLNAPTSYESDTRLQET